MWTYQQAAAPHCIKTWQAELQGETIDAALLKMVGGGGIKVADYNSGAASHTHTYILSAVGAIVAYRIYMTCNHQEYNRINLQCEYSDGAAER